MADPTIVMNFEKDPNIGIHKKVLHAGKGDVPNYVNGTKVLFVLRPLVQVRPYFCGSKIKVYQILSHWVRNHSNLQHA